MKKSLTCILLMSIITCACKNQQDKGTNTNEAETLTDAQVESLKAKLSKNADSASLRMQLVNVLDSLGRFKEALAQTDSLIKRDSLNNGLWFTRGRLSESSGDTASAISSYSKAVAIYPSIDAQLSLANLYAEIKNEKCLAICKNIMRLGLGRETDASCNFITGVYYARTGNTKHAITFFDQCINNSYTYMVAYMEKGFLYYDDQKYEEALKVFKTAVTVNNTYADAYYWVAKCYEALGNKQEALVNYQRAFGLDKELVEAEEAIERLQ